MSTADPQLPFRSTPPVSVYLGDSELIDSGTVVIKPNVPFQIQIANLIYKVRFESPGPENEPRISYADQHDNGYTIVLQNFDNPLGTSLNPIEVGTVSGKKVFVSMWATAPSGRGSVHVLSYAVYWGGDHG